MNTLESLVATWPALSLGRIGLELSAATSRVNLSVRLLVAPGSCS